MGQSTPNRGPVGGCGAIRRRATSLPMRHDRWCTNIVLAESVDFGSCARQDSNLRHVASKATALSPELRARPADRTSPRSSGTGEAASRRGQADWPVGGGSTPPTGPIREGPLAVLTIGRQDDSAGDPTPRMLGECACAVNWDAPGGGTAHATSRPRGSPTGDAADGTRGLEPGPRRISSIRASALPVKGFFTWKARRLLPWHSAGLDSWTGCPMRARTVLVSALQPTPIERRLRLRLTEWP